MEVQTTPSSRVKKRPSAKRVAVLIISVFIVGMAGAFSYDQVVDPYLISKGVLTNGGGDVVVRELQPVSVIEGDAVVDAVARVNPSVVSILSKSTTSSVFNEELQNVASGSGFIVTSDGLIATNRHVVSDAESVQVITQDGETYDAEIVDLDPLSDFAMLKIDADNLPVVNLGFSDELQVGERVIAVGNALGTYDNTVTTGVISGVDRTIVAGGRGASSRLEGLLQIDAAINQGNSGGPLTNLAGDVIGINTAVDAEGAGIGFAIPINDLRPAIDSVIAEGRIIRPLLGVRYVNLTPEFAAVNSLDITQGALLATGGTNERAVVPGGPADSAGLREGDIITAIDGEDITSSRSLARLLQQYSPDESVEIRYVRDGETRTTETRLSEAS